MNCPHCKNEVLIAVEHESVEIDYCVGCRGVWLDAGELELLFGDADKAQAVLSLGSPADVPKGERARRCPECDKRMTKESTEGANPVVFDHCPRGDGLWLDAGELHTILEHADALGNNEVAAFLQGIFAEANE